MTLVGGRTRVYALLGDPVSHTLSPTIHNAAFTALGLDAVYVALRCEAGELPGLMRALAHAGGGGNVTVPYKELAAQVVRGEAAAVSVVNTFWGVEGELHGADTDSRGILEALRGLEAPNGAWCIIGTGGSARAALRAARESGASVSVRSRSPERAGRFLERARDAGVMLTTPEASTLFINCTPLGLRELDPMPFPPDAVAPGAVALDLVYCAGETAWVRALRGRGVRAMDGRQVLLGQGVAAFERWYPGLQAPVEIMRAALRRALD